MGDQFLGEIRMVGFNFAPNGWALCAGQLMSIAQNSPLFSLIGTTFGGDGVTTFALPNYCGRSPVGMGTGQNLNPIIQGEIAGNENVIILSSQMPMHNHVATATATGTATLSVAGTASNPSATPSATNSVLSASGGGPGSATIWSDQLTNPVTLTNTNTLAMAVAVTVQPSGNSLPLPIRNPYLGTNFIIALSGIFPSRP